MSNPAHPIWFDLPNNIWRTAQIAKVLTYCLSTCLYFPALRSQIPLALCCRTHSLYVLHLQIHSKRTSSVVERYRSGFVSGRCPLCNSPFILTVTTEVSYGFFFFFIGIDPYSLTSTAFTMTSHTYEGWNFIVANIYLQLIHNRYMFRSFTVLQCSHQHCVQPVASDVEVVGYL